MMTKTVLLEGAFMALVLPVMVKSRVDVRASSTEIASRETAIQVSLLWIGSASSVDHGASP